MLKLKTGSMAESDTLTRDPTRRCQSRWPGDLWLETWFHLREEGGKANLSVCVFKVVTS